MQTLFNFALETTPVVTLIAIVASAQMVSSGLSESLGSRRAENHPGFRPSQPHQRARLRAVGE